MELKELLHLARRGEGQHLEFKKKANHPEKIVKELVAFANSEGGKLLLGVDDDGTVSGLKEIEGESFVLEEAIKKNIRPQLGYSVEIIPLNEKKGVAVFDIEVAKVKPFFVKDDDSKKGNSYIRLADESIKASKEMREILERRMKNKDIQFTFNTEVKALLRIIEDNNFTTVNDFSDKAKISRYKSARILIRLVLANVLDIIPTDKGDQYILKQNNQ